MINIDVFFSEIMWYLAEFCRNLPIFGVKR